MTVLVTGGCGYIGAQVVRALLEAGRGVVVVDDLSAGTSPGVLPASVPFVEARCQDVAAWVLDCYQVDQVVHLAGRLSVEESTREPLEYWRTNTAATAELLARCVEAGVDQFVLSSTAAVYGPGDPMTEAGSTSPVNPYGHSKLVAEIILRDACVAHGVRGVALRYFNVAGTAHGLGWASGETQLVKRVAMAVKTGERMTVYGDDYETRDGTCVRDYVHVEDIARAHLLALEWTASGEAGAHLTCNLGSGHGATVLEVLAAARKHAPMPEPWRKARREGDPASLVASTMVASERLGWAATHGLDEIVRSTIDWEIHR